MYSLFNELYILKCIQTTKYNLNTANIHTGYLVSTRSLGEQVSLERVAQLLQSEEAETLREGAFHLTYVQGRV